MTLARRYTGLVGVAAVILVFSEFVFLNAGVVAPLLNGAGVTAASLHVAEMLLFYLLFGAVFATAVSAWGAGTLPALMLSGALCGWAIEALLVPVVYEAVPISFVWPSLGWHMIVDIGLGLYLLPALLAARSAVVAISAPVVAGLLWGVWASWIWVEDLRPPPESFMAFSAFVVALLIAGYAIMGWAGTATFSFGRRESLLVAGICLVLGLITGLPFLPWPLALAALAGLTLVALSRGARSARGLDWLPIARVPLPPIRLALLASAVPSASLGYAWIHAEGRMIEAELVSVPLLFLGGGIFVWALLHTFTRN